MSRDFNIDFLKGFAILLMVMGHYLAGSISGIEDCGPHSWTLGSLIYSFHMPLFFVLSGMLCGKKDSAAGLFKNILHKVKALLLPGFTFMLIGYFCSNKVQFEMAWFLKVLFQIWLVFLIVQFSAGRLRLSFNLEIIIHVLVFATLFCISHFTKGSFVCERIWFHAAVARYPYFVLGYVISKLNLEEKYHDKNWLFTLALVVYAISYICTTGFLNGKIVSYIKSYITAPAASVCCLFVGHKILYQFGNCNWYKTICYLGRNTLSIYLLHSYFIITMPALAKVWANMSCGPSICVQLFSSLIVSALSIMISLLIEYVISQSRILSFVFFGKGDIKGFNYRKGMKPNKD